MLTADLSCKLSFAPCIVLIGDAKYTNVRANNVRFSNRPFGVKRFQTIHHRQC